jgi:hypothetical protein
MLPAAALGPRAVVAKEEEEAVGWMATTIGISTELPADASGGGGGYTRTARGNGRRRRRRRRRKRRRERGKNGCEGLTDRKHRSPSSALFLSLRVGIVSTGFFELLFVFVQLFLLSP